MSEHGDPEQSLTSRISNAIVRCVKDTTGRGPTKARTVYAHDLVSCVMQDTLTVSEKTLVENGEERTVLATRQRLQAAMREDAVAEVEALTGRKVIAFMSENHIEPDLAVETFILEPVPETAA